MGFADKLKFWKKDDDLGMGSDFGGLDSGAGPGSDFGGGLGSNAGPGDLGPGQGDLGGGMGIEHGGLGGMHASAQAHPGAPSYPGMQAPHDEMGHGEQHLQSAMDMGHSALPSSSPAQHQGLSSAMQRREPEPDIFGPSAPSQGHVGSSSDYMVGKEIEIISSKLDALKAAIDSMNQRLLNIEDMIKGEVQQKRKNVW